MGGGMRACLDLEPHHHALLAGEHPARDLVGDLFIGNCRERSKTLQCCHGVSSFSIGLSGQDCPCVPAAADAAIPTGRAALIRLMNSRRLIRSPDQRDQAAATQ
jgi:hypothetical protein